MPENKYLETIHRWRCSKLEIGILIFKLESTLPTLKPIEDAPNCHDSF
jgi:hypothetical protein